MQISVIIPTYQRRDLVIRAVLALSRQDVTEPYEVIVVVDGSTDGTAEALRQLEAGTTLTVIEQPNAGSAAARNRGAAAARGELLLFLDDDMEADPRLLAEHLCAHRAGADAVLGDIPLHPDSPPGLLSDGVREWAARRSRRLAMPGAEIGLEDMLTGQLSVRRRLFFSLGGFDTRFRQRISSANADTDFGSRLLDGRWRVVFHPAAVSWQHYVVTPRQYLRHWHEIGRADVRYADKHPDRAAAVFTGRKLSQRRSWMRPPLAQAVRWAAVVRASGGRTDRLTARLLRRARWYEYWRGVSEEGGMPRRAIDRRPA